MSTSTGRLGLVLALGLAARAGADVIFVSDSNCPGPGSGTIFDPYCSIQDAIDVADDGDTVQVGAGTYPEAIDLGGKAIAVVSIFGADQTYIAGSGSGRVVTCDSGEGPATVLDGFTITGGLDAGGMLIDDSSPTVVNCAFISSTAEAGAAINVVGSSASPTISDCTFRDNSATYGGAIHRYSGDVTVLRCLFAENDAYAGGAIHHGYPSGLVRVDACTFVGNTGFRGGAAYSFAEPSPAEARYTNCVFSGNVATIEGGAHFGGYAFGPDPVAVFSNCTFAGNEALGGGADVGAVLANCIVWGNTLPQLAPSQVSSSIVEGSYSGVGIIDADPAFVDPDGADDIVGTEDDDLRLLACSPAIDAGNNSLVPSGVAEDLDGAPRFNDAPGISDAGSGVAPIVDMGAYEVQVNGGFTVAHVPADFPTIQAAIDGVCDGGEVIVSPGTYHEAIDFNGRAITVRSLTGAAFTVIDGEDALPGGADADHVVRSTSGEGPDTVLDGFTITNGFANDPGPESRGGGMYVVGSNPTVMNCAFVGNTASGGGGGMCNDGSDPKVINCVFSGNSAGFAVGGGMLNTGSSPTIVNCSFTANSAANGGSAMRNASSSAPLIANSILWGDNFDEVSNDGTSAPIAGFSNVQGGFAGGAFIIDADPRFVDADGPDDVPGTPDDDLRLDRFSPSVDAGGNESLPPDVTADADGKPRYVNDQGVADTGFGTAPFIDHGPYERQDDSLGITLTVTEGESIQEAIDLALDGFDEVLVEPGTYVEAIDFGGKAIAVRSTAGALATTIDGAGADHVVRCASGEGPGVVLEGFTITGGHANGAGGDAYGAGMLVLASSPTVIGCIFRANVAVAGGGAIFCASASPSIINCAFDANTASLNGGALAVTGSSFPDVINCTFTANSAHSGGGMHTSTVSASTVVSCIFWGDSFGEIVTDGTSITAVTYSVVQGGHSGAGNIAVNPTFVDADGPDDIQGTADDNLRLRRFSPCIDKGNSGAVPPGVTTDVAGLPRFFDDTGVANGGAGPSPIVDMGAWERQVPSTALAIYVPRDAPTIQAAIDESADNDEIIVAPGVYVEAIDFGGREITLRSSNGPRVTTIDGNGAEHVVRCTTGEGPGAVLDGFTITGGDADGTGQNDSGGGMYNNGSSPTVRNCIFTGNAADQFGGGMYNFQSQPTVVNCIFTGNASLQDGGAVLNSGGGPTFVNCTFFDNDAQDQGDGIFNTASATAVTNSILWANGAQQIFNELGAPPTVTYSIVQGGYAGTGNSAADPIFVDEAGPDDVAGTADDDLRLGGCSPAIDAGSNSAVPPGVTSDIDGEPRFVEDDNVPNTGSGSAPLVDLGALERQVDSLPAGLEGSVPGTHATIQDAIDAACGESTITVAAGAYFGSIDLRGKPVTLRSAAGAGSTTLHAGGAPHVVQCTSGEGPDTVIDGFTITGGAGTSYGAGVLNVGSSATFVNCRITGNTSNQVGAGMYNAASSPTVVNCVFSDNATGPHAGGAAMYNAQGSAPTVVNCMIIENTGLGGAIWTFQSTSTIVNCIFRDNTLPHVGGSGTSVTYSIVPGGFSGAGNFDADPMFVDADGADGIPGTPDDDFRLLPCSPAIDAGNAAAVPAGVTEDLDGNARLVDDAGIDDTGLGGAPVVDIGVYERQSDSYSGPTVHVPAQAPTIQSAIDGTCAGVEIVVAPGTYVEAIEFRGRPVTLRSSGGAEVTTIDGDGATHVVECARDEGPDTVLEGFTITGGHASGFSEAENGGGMYVHGSPTVSECIFSGNTADERGGGMHIAAGSPTVIGCVFEGNAAQFSGGAISTVPPSSPTISGCSFVGNQADDRAGGISLGVGVVAAVTGCTFVGNSAGTSAGAVWSHSGLSQLANCAFSGNTANLGGAILVQQLPAMAVTNCTFTGNAGPAIRGGATLTNCIVWDNAGVGLDLWSGSVTFSLVEGGWAGTGNVDLDPLFVDPDGSDNVVGTIDDDLRLAACSPAVDAGNVSAVPAGTVTDLGGGVRFVDDAGVADTGTGPAPIVDMGAWERQTSSFDGGTAFVPGEYSTIQDAIDSACGEGEIVVAPGVYIEAIDFRGKPLVLRSALGPAVTIIDGAGAAHVVDCVSGEGPDTVLDGFTITGGDALGAPNQNGGGMRISSSSPTVTNCVFAGNSANRGGGLSLSGSASTVINCVFTGNSAAFQGGGIWASNAPTIVNCTFSGNESFNGGALFAQSGSTANVTNCVFRGNSVNTIESLSAGLAVTFSNVEGGWPGAGNIDADPLFADADGADDAIGTIDDDVHLLGGSPCIDAGNNGAVPIWIATDYDGDERIIDGDSDAEPTVDMGADEVSFVDCNGNRIADADDIASRTSTDENDNGVPDECECPNDFDSTGDVGFSDLTMLLIHWGPCPPDPQACPWDVDSTGDVGFGDLTSLLIAWGGCS